MRRASISILFVGIFVMMLASIAGAAQVLLSEDFNAIPNGQLPPGFTPYDGKWSVQNGRLVGTSPDSSTLTRITFGDPTWSNYEISATMTYTWAKEPKRWAAIMHRVQPNGGPPYSLFTIRQGTTASNGLEIAYRTTDPKWLVHTTAAYRMGFAINETHRVRVVVYGSDVYAFIDDEPVLQLADAVKETQGQVGLHVCGSTVAFDDVIVKSIDANDLASMGIGAPSAVKEKTQLERLPQVIAHRGASAVAPENTAAAFTKALEMGADLIELDVQRSRDGHLIVMHDSSVDRTAKGDYKGNIANLTLEQIKSLDAGSWKGLEYKGEKVLTLEEALTAFRGKATFLIEIKAAGIEAQVAAAIKNTNMVQSVVVQSFSTETVRKFRAVLPEVPAGVLFNNSSISDSVARANTMAKQTMDVNGLFAAVAYASVTPEFVKQMTAKGLPVYAWTVDDEMSIRRMINAGVTGIITNRPDRVRAILENEYSVK